MSEWWSYRLADFLMFSAQTYFRQFELYHRAIWPLHLLAAAALLLILYTLWRRRERLIRLTLFLCACAWLWQAWVYHWQRFAEINLAAGYYAVGFVMQGLLLLGLAIFNKDFTVVNTAALKSKHKLFLLALVVLIHPLSGLLLGRGWRQAELILLTPDATALLTLAVLLILQVKKIGWFVLLPLLWLLISCLTLAGMAVPEFYSLTFVSSVTLMILISSAYASR